MVISSWVGACPVTPLPIVDHLGHSRTSNRPKKQAPGKADQVTIGNDTYIDFQFVNVEIGWW